MKGARVPQLFRDIFLPVSEIDALLGNAHSLALQIVDDVVSIRMSDDGVDAAHSG